ncbi:5'-3' exonuclease [Sporolactobacillus spathodeae]|uniref:5'-3' exonuclease n=1 Tax=Sporolactobacillus spathodeae TaxID=1465502 RepID=A0ABS2Q8R6_9BACL|nr:5'-3' exonuclease [Sporolactobacillus spathodeae]MBM7658177.1 5'-3' exonuclease [Sporolactobacillus spathodeae]
MKRPKLLLIDGMALLFRAFYATAPSGQFMINGRGVPTNGVQGFLRHLLIAIEAVQPSYVAVCWDTGKKTFRHELFDGYKANRSAPPIEMLPQFDLARSMTDAFGIPNVGVAGYEADDCIGTLSRTLHQKIDIRIVTGDRDLLQLLAPHVHVRLLQKGYGNYHRFTETLFQEVMGITPEQFIDVKALMGDASDGYPGVHGIGEKTALKLIKQFGSLDALLGKLDEIPAGQQKKIVADTDMLLLSRRLAAIHCSVPIDFEMGEAAYHGVPESFVERVHDEEMKLVQLDLRQRHHLDNLRATGNFPH